MTPGAFGAVPLRDAVGGIVWRAMPAPSRFARR